MRLQPVRLQGRRFAIQLREILAEFGETIPWLHDVRGLEYATNGTYCRDRLLAATGQEEDELKAYQFVESDRARTFIGGMMSFATSPERLRDRRNQAIVDELTSLGFGYATCLQIRSDHRGLGHGSALMVRATNAVLKERGPVWGVISDPRLVPWYRNFGAVTPSPRDNRDKLWIVHWSHPLSLPKPPASA